MTTPDQTRAPSTPGPAAEPDLGFTLGAGLAGTPAAGPAPANDAAAGPAPADNASAGPGPADDAAGPAPMDDDAAGPEPGETPSAPAGTTTAEPGPNPTPTAPDPVEQATELSRRIAGELAIAAPDGWRRLRAAFALTAAAETALVVCTDDDERAVQVHPPDEVLALVRRHRAISAGLGDGPWWRYLLTLDSDGTLEVDHDFGAEPFPAEHLFAPEVYLADLEVFPRGRLPVWLAAYLYHGDRQARPPAAARADHLARPGAAVPEDGLPPLPLMVARWSVLAAVFVAIGSPLGPRVLPAAHLFEGVTRSGSSLFVLPGGRAVLSGGVWDAPELDAAYNDGAELPALFAGAPAWVTHPMLNSRASSGLLSFCYWWDQGRWFRAQSPAPDAIAPAVPGVWSAETAAGIITALLAEAADSATPPQLPDPAAIELVRAAEAGVVHRDTALRGFGAAGVHDPEAGLLQLGMAGIVVEETPIHPRAGADEPPDAAEARH
ncbi:hypothetical protein [Nocardia harenae]|uniref:hypothetical protein n=1 Tax=Nocardia harenae TaxID=358707 RepID=UPI00082F0A0D|nr:hypothetical protein [Nocardia harenae]